MNEILQFSSRSSCRVSWELRRRTICVWCSLKVCSRRRRSKRKTNYRESWLRSERSWDWSTLEDFWNVSSFVALVIDRVFASISRFASLSLKDHHNTSLAYSREQSHFELETKYRDILSLRSCHRWRARWRYRDDESRRVCSDSQVVELALRVAWTWANCVRSNWVKRKINQDIIDDVSFIVC